MDISLHYIEKGSGFPLVLLHGNGESGDYFVRQMDVFALHWRVIAVDTRGHGHSPRGTAPFTIDQFAEDLHDFLLSHQIPKAHILGFSDGGNIALTFALKYPDMVDHLILDGANLFPAGVDPVSQTKVEELYTFLRPLAPNDSTAMKKYELLALMVEQPNIDPASLHKLTVPTLVAAGTQDVILREHTELIFRSLPNATLALIEGDHFIARDNSEVFNQTVMDFLKKSEI